MGEYTGEAVPVITLSLHPADFGHCQSKKMM